MPVFVDEATAARDRRVLPSYAPRLPRISSESTAVVNGDAGADEKYEVVVVGVSVAFSSSRASTMLDSMECQF